MNRPDPAGGLLQSLRRLTDTLVGIVQVRVELFGTELEQQKHRVFDALVWAAIGLMLAGLALVLFVAFVLLLFQDAYRLPAVAVLSLGFGLGAWALLRRARAHLLSDVGGPFALSLGELRRDREALTESPKDVP
jgi:uncharacterized membrane protein YqjE